MSQGVIPILQTERLTLRANRADDFAGYAAFVASDATRYMGGPLGTAGAWNWFTSDIAQWHLFGHGALAIDETATGAHVGQVAVVKPPNTPEVMIGWMAYHEGKGFMTEACRAMLDWAFGPGGLSTVVAYIDAQNPRSVALAQRLGGTLDTAAATPSNMKTDVWRFQHA